MLSKAVLLYFLGFCALVCQEVIASEECKQTSEDGTETVVNICEDGLVCCHDNVFKCCNSTDTTTEPAVKYLPHGVDLSEPKDKESRDHTADVVPLWEIGPGDDAVEDMQVDTLSETSLGGQIDDAWIQRVKSGKLPKTHPLWLEKAPPSTNGTDVEAPPHSSENSGAAH